MLPRASVLCNRGWPGSGLSVAQFAARAGIHNSTVSEIYRGRRWPEPDTALLILEATGGAVSVWDVTWYRANRRIHAARQIGRRTPPPA